MLDGNFEWDNDKAASNLAKHGVTFEMARDVFNDPFLLEWADQTQDETETRYAAIGMIENRLLFVAYALRGDIIRIISARRAVAIEKRRYHNEIQT